jgi:2,4-dienoyl-CoA reductase-like NADH-dependent reductase (Old Yellow Enzyme family)
MFKHLFEPITIKETTIRNRIMSTGHDTMLPTDGVVNDQLVAYHEARAAGGVGLIVLQVSGIHETAQYTTHMLMATEDRSIEGYRQVADAIHRHGATVFAQVFHPGREILEAPEGMAPVAYAPSVSPNERFHVMPRPLSRRVIGEIVSGFGDAARRMWSAGIDGVEIVASHGYLPSQFLNPRVNRRDDEYGGSLENRLRLLREIMADIRSKTPESFIMGLRISGNEMDHEGLSEDESLAAIEALAEGLDYVNVIAGTSSSAGGAIHIVPPMTVKNAYVAPYAAKVRERVRIPVFVAGRINQPQEAEAILASGQADVCGMTRAMISDPEMPNKAREGRTDDIRACIGCNQACIGHFQKGIPISCIQHPQTGREIIFKSLKLASQSKRVMVVGGGPAGMKAAVTAAARGHEVTLFEAEERLGGQALLAQLLPGRAEFGGLVTNLLRELELSQVQIRKGVRVDRSLIEQLDPDAIIVATGARPFKPDLVQEGEIQVVDAWEVLQGEVAVGTSVLVADWRSDWVGIGLAEHLARKGCSVRLAVTATMAGETIPSYVRDHSIATLHRLSVQIIPYARLYGCDTDTVYLQHTASGEPMVIEGVDTLVLCQGHAPEMALSDALDTFAKDVHVIGDCLAPRTAEEAIFEAVKAATAL